MTKTYVVERFLSTMKNQNSWFDGESLDKVSRTGLYGRFI